MSWIKFKLEEIRYWLGEEIEVERYNVVIPFSLLVLDFIVTLVREF